jgi:hypothetical protein
VQVQQTARIKEHSQCLKQAQVRQHHRLHIAQIMACCSDSRGSCVYRDNRNELSTRVKQKHPRHVHAYFTVCMLHCQLGNKKRPQQEASVVFALRLMGCALTSSIITLWKCDMPFCRW